jgi:hypothetical protein
MDMIELLFLVAQQPRGADSKLAMTRQPGAGSLRALASVHARGVVHGSIGSGSFMASTLDDARTTSLKVKLDNLGFGQMFIGGSGPQSGLEKGKRADREALAVMLCELTFGVPRLVCAGLLSQRCSRPPNMLANAFTCEGLIRNCIIITLPPVCCLPP